MCRSLPCSALIAINHRAVRVGPLDMVGLAAVNGADPAKTSFDGLALFARLAGGQCHPRKVVWGCLEIWALSRSKRALHV